MAFAARYYQPSALIRSSGLLTLGGLVLFSGSLYALSLTGRRWIGMFTPFGGTAFLAGWLLLAVGSWRSRKV